MHLCKEGSFLDQGTNGDRGLHCVELALAALLPGVEDAAARLASSVAEDVAAERDASPAWAAVVPVVAAALALPAAVPVWFAVERADIQAGPAAGVVSAASAV